jgi:8-oxo-dGTP pyrophosphatase MutT (NUDIX family)
MELPSAVYNADHVVEVLVGEQSPSGVVNPLDGANQAFDLLTTGRSGTLHLTDAAAYQAWYEAFRHRFRYLEAAGGVVSTGSAILVIHRLGNLDLPKGKIEPGENPAQAAVREIEEETGLHGVFVQANVQPFCTWHVYEQRGEWHLKKTWWFACGVSIADTALTPQHEEGIAAAWWMPLVELTPETLPTLPTWPTIRRVLAWYTGLR